MENDFKNLIGLWKNYNNASKLLAEAMGGTANEVGEFAEKLISIYYNANQLPSSNMSADLLTEDGKYIQVKSRKIERLAATSLNVIRSWDFDVLVVVLFSKYGDILKAIEIDSNTARSISKLNKHQNGYILTTSKELLNNKNSVDITKALRKIMSFTDEYLIQNEKIAYKSHINKGVDTNMNIKKRDAINIVNRKIGKILKNSNTIFSNINSKKDVWWFDPINSRFKNDFYLLLNDSRNKIIYYFFISGGTVKEPTKIFRQRPDKGDKSHIKIHIDDKKFNDCIGKQFSFYEYFQEAITY